MNRNYIAYSIVALALAFPLLAGCGQSSNTSSNTNGSTPGGNTQNVAANSTEHGHQRGAHGGNIVVVGHDNYHVEAIFEKGGAVRLFTLGQDESVVHEVESQELTAYVKIPGASEYSSFRLAAEPQPGDSAGKTSAFLGQLPEEYVGREVEITIPSIVIDAKRYRIAFVSQSEEHAADMPQAIATTEEEKLYLTPGGLYTLEDIAANGNQTASQRFKNFKAKHDLKPKPGDKICPITLTKANSECAWVVHGQKYEFCCPPCVNEFVAMAKEAKSADEIKQPTDYVK